jgi:hypothetical protein
MLNYIEINTLGNEIGYWLVRKLAARAVTRPRYCWESKFRERTELDGA